MTERVTKEAEGAAIVLGERDERERETERCKKSEVGVGHMI